MKKFCIIIICALLTTLSAKAQVSTTTDTTNIVYVVYNGNNASVTISNNVTNYVSATINGGHVSITQSENVSLTTCGEITYALSGSSGNGSFYMEGSFKSTVELHGLTLTNQTGPAINIQNGKRIEVSIKRGTTNTLTDGTSTAVDAWKGCFQCKGHTEFKGYGTLNIYANYAHGIWSKEYITVKNCTINILSAVKDAINCNQYFTMESGEINLSGFGDDGIQVSLKNNDTSADNTGNFTLNGGSINIDMQNATGSSVKAAGTRVVASTATLNIANATAINMQQADNNTVDIYTPHGIYLGRYQNINTAAQQINSGMYIINTTQGSKTIIIK